MERKTESARRKKRQQSKEMQKKGPGGDVESRDKREEKQRGRTRHRVHITARTCGQEEKERRKDVIRP